jgi:hypothetical protein
LIGICKGKTKDKRIMISEIEESIKGVKMRRLVRSIYHYFITKTPRSSKVEIIIVLFLYLSHFLPSATKDVHNFE